MTETATEGAVTPEAGKGEAGATLVTPAQDKPEEANPETASPEAGKGEGTENQETEQDAEGDKSEKVGAPEEYEDFKAPEGVELNEEVLNQFKPVAKELNLTQEQAQKLVDFQAAQVAQHQAETQEYFGNLMSEWQQAVKEDSEIGGKAFDENIANAKAAIEAFGSKELIAVLDETGMGNHPEFVRVFARMGKAIKEDGIRVGNSNPGGPKDPASILFPNQK